MGREIDDSARMYRFPEIGTTWTPSLQIPPVCGRQYCRKDSKKRISLMIKFGSTRDECRMIAL
eukprot:1392905-Amorphochlora_amoeboformis.AAC.2